MGYTFTIQAYDTETKIRTGFIITYFAKDRETAIAAIRAIIEKGHEIIGVKDVDIAQ